MQLSNQQISFALNSIVAIVTIVMPTENCAENDFVALERERNFLIYEFLYVEGNRKQKQAGDYSKI